MADRITHLQRLIDRVREGYAPDPRIAVFEVGFEWDETTVSLIGATSQADAADTLRHEAAMIDGWTEVRDLVERLPTARAGEPIHAIATAAVVPLLAGPVISETHVSQVVMGRRLMVLRRQGRWLLCRAEDGYLGWVHRGYVRVLAEVDARAWEIGTGGEACISLGAAVYDGQNEVVARLPWGSRVLRLADGSVQMPDGKVGRAEGELLPLAERAHRHRPEGTELVATAARWLGAPYLWGGVTMAGVDCSGLVQAVLHLHGITLPRDSDQQARVGEPIQTDAQFSTLRAGDLMFFAETPERVSHVTMSIGGSRIIHSSLGNGGVARNDLMGDLPYERELRDLFVCARRHL